MQARRKVIVGVVKAHDGIGSGKKSRRRVRHLHPALTPRELEIVKLVAHGLTNPKIAKQLFLSIETVKTHVKHILGKLGATDRTQAGIEAMRRGII